MASKGIQLKSEFPEGCKERTQLVRFRDLGRKYFYGRHASPPQSSFLTFVCFLIQIEIVHFNKTIICAFIF